MARTPNNDIDANHILLAGGSNMGKSSVIKIQLAKRKPKRAVCWDFKNEYGKEGFIVCQTLAELSRCMRSGKNGRFAYCGQPEEFERFCRLVWAWGDCLVIFEELGSSVRGVGKAQQYLGMIYRVGRGYGIETIATTTSPQEIPKTVQENVTESFIFRLKREAGRKRIMQDLDIKDPGSLPVAKLQCLHHVDETSAFTKNIVTYSNGKPRIRKVKEFT